MKLSMCFLGFSGLLRSLGVLLLAFADAPALAFKVETHVWVAQQIINELERSPQLSIRLGHQTVAVQVRPELRSAVLANKELFRMGSIGPDALPGIYEGQMTIHPGAGNKGWGTGDWLMHAVRHAHTPAETAFAYGMLLHAAADVFAHTYVNQYAGDVYLLADGEIDVETRHFLLEGYIAERMPPMLDHTGKDLGSPVTLIRRNGGIAVPTEYLRRVFVEHASAAKQFGDNGAPHMRAIRDLNRSIEDVTRKNGPLDKVRLLAQKIVIYYWTDYQAKDEDIRKLNDLHQKIHNATNKGIDQLQQLDQSYRQQTIKAVGKLQKAERDALDRATDLLKKIRAAHEALDDAEKKLAKAADDLKGLKDGLEERTENECHNVVLNPCVRIAGLKGPPGCDAVSQSCKQVKKMHTVLHPLRKPLTELVKANTALRHQAFNHLDGHLKEFRGAIDKVHNASISVLKTEAALLKNSVDFLQRFTQDSDPIFSLLKAWLEDNNLALDQYFMANATSISVAMQGGDVLEPLKRWWNCSAPTFMGIPSQITNSVCAAKPMIADIQKAMDALEKLAVGHDPLMREVQRLKKDVDKLLEKAKDDAIKTMASRILGVDIENLAKILKVKPTKGMVDEAFAKTSASKKLVAFQKVSDRIDREMALDAKGRLDPAAYAVVYNAMVLAKLAMLDPSALNQLIGQPLFKPSPMERSNVMFRFASSIDGNHQWRQKPPPYPRSNKKHACGKAYGYAPAFVLFKDEPMRRKVFAQLFKGPLSPGLETPEVYGLPRALPADYPYQPSAKNPFPSNDMACVR